MSEPNLGATSRPASAAQPVAGRRVLRGILHQGVSNFSSSLTSLVVVPLVIKTSGAATYGIFVLLNSVLTLTAQAFTLGAGYKARRQLPAAEDAADRARIFIPNLSFQSITYGVATLVLLVALPKLDLVLFHTRHPYSLWIVPLGIIAIFLNTLTDDYFRYTQRLQFVSSSALFRAGSYIALVLFFGLGLHSLSVNGILVAQSIATIAPALVLFWYLGREIPLRFRLDPRSQHLWDIRFGFPLASAVLIENFLSASDRYVLAGYLSPVYVGAYAAAAAVGGLILLVPKIVSAVLPAALSHAVDSGGKAEAVAIFQEVMRFYLMIAFPFVAGATLLGRPLLVLFANEQVAALAHRVVPFIALGSALYGYSWLVFSVIFVQMRTRLWFWSNVTAGSIALSLTLVLVGIWHRIDYAALAMAIGYAVGAAVIVLARSRDWPLHLELASIVRVLAATVVMSLVVTATGRFGRLESWPGIILMEQILGGVAAYAGSLWAVGALNRTDIRRLLAGLRPVSPS